MAVAHRPREQHEWNIACFAGCVAIAHTKIIVRVCRVVNANLCAVIFRCDFNCRVVAHISNDGTVHHRKQIFTNSCTIVSFRPERNGIFLLVVNFNFLVHFIVCFCQL